MGILSKASIKKALQNPFCFILIFLLVILTLANSFALWCFIGAIISIPFALIGKDVNSTIQFFCKDSSWKMKGIEVLSNILGRHTILILILGIILWVLLNKTKKGEELLELLD